MRPDDPPRLRAALPPEDRLALGIEALRAEEPAAPQLFQVETRLKLALARGRTADEGARHDPPQWTRLLRTLLIGAAAGTAFAAAPTLKRALLETPPAAAPAAVPSGSASVKRGEVSRAVPERTPERAAVASATPNEPNPKPAATSAEAAPPASVPAELAELPLLARAQSLLSADPRAALALTAEHERRFGSAGTYAAEREAVAIDALLRLGGRSQAEERARRFRQTFPGSAYQRRIDVLLGRTP